MPTVVIDPELYRQVEEVATTHSTSTEQVFSEAVRLYLWEMNRRKISEESKRYREQHHQLKATYLGQYIAMHDGQVVDHDADFQQLYRRVLGRFGDTPVMMTLVAETAEPVLVKHGFQFDS